MHLRPRLNSLEKNCLHNLSGVPNTGSSGDDFLNFFLFIKFNLEVEKV